MQVRAGSAGIYCKAIALNECCAAPFVACALYTRYRFTVDAGQEHLKTTRLKPGGTARVNCDQCLQPLFNDISMMHLVSVFPTLFADFQLRPQYHLFAEEVGTCSC